MKLLPLDLAHLAVLAYNEKADWTFILTGPRYGNSTVCVLVDEARQIIHVCCQGTVPGLDFLKDLEAAFSTRCANVGIIPYGFDLGMIALYQRLFPMVKPGWALTLNGHSLGAAQAAILAALFVAGGKIPSAVMLLACPRVGSAVARLLADCTSVYSFVNGPDPVPEVPVLFAHPVAPPLRINVSPALPEIGLEWHSSALYLQGVAALALPEFEFLPVRNTIMTDPVTAASPVPTPVPLAPELHESLWQKFEHFLAELTGAVDAAAPAIEAGVAVADPAAVPLAAGSVVALNAANAGVQAGTPAAAVANLVQAAAVVKAMTAPKPAV